MFVRFKSNVIFWDDCKLARMTIDYNKASPLYISRNQQYFRSLYLHLHYRQILTYFEQIFCSNHNGWVDDRKVDSMHDPHTAACWLCLVESWILARARPSPWLWYLGEPSFAALILAEYPGGDTMMTPRKFPQLALSEPSPAEFRKYTVWQSQLHDSQLPAASCQLCLASPAPSCCCC